MTKQICFENRRRRNGGACPRLHVVAHVAEQLKHINKLENGLERQQRVLTIVPTVANAKDSCGVYGAMARQ